MTKPAGATCWLDETTRHGWLAHSDYTNYVYHSNNERAADEGNHRRIIKQYGRLADRALIEPSTITRNGHDRVVVLSVDEYRRLKRAERRVVPAGELTETEIRLIGAAEVPAEHAGLDEELKHWHP